MIQWSPRSLHNSSHSSQSTPSIVHWFCYLFHFIFYFSNFTSLNENKTTHDYKQSIKSDLLFLKQHLNARDNGNCEYNIWFGAGKLGRFTGFSFFQFFFWSKLFFFAQWKKGFTCLKVVTNFIKIYMYFWYTYKHRMQRLSRQPAQFCC